MPIVGTLGVLVAYRGCDIDEYWSQVIRFIQLHKVNAPFSECHDLHVYTNIWINVSPCDFINNKLSGYHLTFILVNHVLVIT